MKHSMSVSGESHDHKIAAIVAGKSEANVVVEELLRDTSLEREQVTVVSPDDQHQGAKLEPEDRGIVRTAIRAHIILAIVGALLGFVLFWVLLALGFGLVAESGVVAASVMTVFGGVFGLLAGGLVTLRPDHGPYLARAQAALRKGQFVVSVHATTHAQLNEAKAVLTRKGLKLTTSL